MTLLPILFFDDGGVMNDNNARAPQWRRLVGEFFAPLLGGAQEAWQEANAVVSERLFDPGYWQAPTRAVSDYASFYRIYQQDWLLSMCELVGVAAPPVEESNELAQRAEDYITRRVHASFPDVIDTIRLLHRQGYTLYTASGTSSSQLAGNLEAMGVLECFRALYGADLINTFKEGPEYYERIFADADVRPVDALIVDDSSMAVGWAKGVGARIVLVTDLPSDGPSDLHITSLAELPALLQQIG